MDSLAMDKWKFDVVVSYKQCLCLIMISSMVVGREFGLVSPIEVVEEWGCQDSEIRLTCSSIDSHIAILEATFKPNCSTVNSKFTANNNTSSGEENYNCVHFDIERLSPPNTTPKFDPQKTVSIAGRRFLEVLRQNHDVGKDSVSPDPIVQNVQTASFGPGIQNENTKNDFKKRRMALRASLEELLEEYLRGFASESDETIKGFSRVKKRSVNSESAESRQKMIMSKEKFKSAISNVENSGKIDENIAYDGKLNITNSTFCPERRQHITQLDRNELSDAIQKNSNNEFNIRKILNHRCSGKNHCSFVFSEDHPFSTVWPKGVVHIKYICMELNELPEPDPDPVLVHQSAKLKGSLKSKNEKEAFESEHVSSDLEGPVTEPLIQNDQMFHSLKILKSSPPEIQNHHHGVLGEDTKSAKLSKGVFYSQDFRVMKILPANLDDFNDIEKVGDEFVFRNEADANIDRNVDSNDLKNTVEPNLIFKINSIDDQNGIGAEDKFRDIRSTVGYNEIQNGKNIRLATPKPVTVTNYHHSIPDAWDNELFTPNSNIFETWTNDDSIFVPAINYTHDQLVELKKSTDSVPKLTVINPNRADVERIEWESDEEYESSYEDYAIEINGPKISRKNKIRVHTSYQKTAVHQPLLQQGFIASPGYPKYYIGNFNCSWRITAPNEHRIKLVILDISLRYDTVCKDFLQIADIGNKHILFQNCTELTMPLEILSESNEIQIALKTTSTLVYPKRGILIYYSVIGCILPTAPKRSRIVSRSENAITFLCDPSFIFSGTNENTRTLYCTKRNIWNKNLPNCVEHKAARSGEEKPSIQSLWKQNKGGVTGESGDDSGAYDVLIPSLVIIGLLLVNALILLVIWRFRNKYRKTGNQNDGVAQL